MKTRFLPFIALSVLLITGCNDPIPKQDISRDDPRFLQGTYSGTLLEDLSPRATVSAGGRIYITDGTRLKVVNVQNGVVEKRQMLSFDTTIMAARSDDTLLLIDGSGKLRGLDTSSLQTKSVPELTFKTPSLFSSDGEWVFVVSGKEWQRYSTRTGQEVVFPASVPVGDGTSISVDGGWAKLAATGRVMNLQTGATFDSASKATFPDRCSSKAAFSLAGVEPQNTSEWVVLGYGAGHIEIRDVTGKVLREVQLPGEACQIVLSLVPVSATQVVAQHNASYSLLDVQTGTVIPIQTLVSNQNTRVSTSITTAGILDVPRVQNLFFPAVNGVPRITRWDNSTVPVQLAKLPLTLNTTMTWVTDQSAQVSGSGELNGEAVQVSGELLLGMDMKLKAQMRAPAYSAYVRLDLNRSGEVIAKVSGGTLFADWQGPAIRPTDTGYFLHLSGQQDHQEYGGILKR